MVLDGAIESEGSRGWVVERPQVFHIGGCGIQDNGV